MKTNGAHECIRLAGMVDITKLIALRCIQRLPIPEFNYGNRFLFFCPCPALFPGNDLACERSQFFPRRHPAYSKQPPAMDIAGAYFHGKSNITI